MTNVQPSLILIYGPVGAGKSTLAQQYISEHPLALSIEADVLVAMHGQWLTHEDEARDSVFELIKAMTAVHLRNGKDVVLPYFLANASQADELAMLADECHARFYEVAVEVDKKEATKRLFARGTWGEPGAPPLTENDLPIIDELYEKMQSTLMKRPHTPRITSYKELLFVLSDSSPHYPKDVKVRMHD